MTQSKILLACLALACATVANSQVNTWVYKSHMSTPRSSAAAATGQDGRIYLFGGGLDSLSSAEAYDPSTDSWSSIAGMPESVYGAKAVTMPDGLILIIGGTKLVENNGGGSSDPFPVQSVFAYDSTSDSYTQKADIPLNTSDIAAALGDDGRVYCFENNSSSGFNTYAYDEAANKWIQCATSPSGLHKQPVAVTGPNGIIYLAGGTANNTTADTSAFTYSGKADVWTTIPNMLDGRWALGAALGGNGQVYEIGGFISGNTTDAVNAYDAGTSAWSTVPHLQTARGGVACATDANGRIYAFGGTEPSTFAAVDSVECYQPPLLSGKAANFSAQEGTQFNGTVATFEDFNTSQTSSDFTATIDWGDGNAPEPAIVSGNGGAGLFKVTASHTYAHYGPFTATVTITDADGETAPVTDAATITDAHVTLGGATVTAQSNVAFSGLLGTLADANPLAQASDFSATIDWGDGSTSNATILDDPAGGKFDIDGTHTYTATGTYALKITINETGGGTFSIHEPANVVAPSAVVTAGHITAVEGANFNGQVATFADADPSQTPANFTATIDWGDGTTSTGSVTANGSGGFNVSGNHTYAEEGSYAVIVTVAVTGGLNSSSTGSAHVSDASITASGFDLICKGTNFSNTVASFTDADLLGTASDYAASIYWGDGKSSNGTIVAAGSGWKVVGSHSYLKRGKYTVIITIRDMGGATASATTHINVGPVK